MDFEIELFPTEELEAYEKASYEAYEAILASEVSEYAYAD